MSDCFETDKASIIRHREGPLNWVEVRRPELREFYVTYTPHNTIGTDDAAAQAREVYRALASWFGEQSASGVHERIFGSLAHREAILAERQAFLRAESVPEPWPASFIEGAPCDQEGLAGVHLYAVAGPRCSPIYNDDRLCGVTFEHRDTQHVYLSGLCGLGSAGSRQEETREMFAQAHEILLATGCSYADVVRTWIYLADILEWYDEFNPVRSAFYSELHATDRTGSCWPPASTGIAGRPPAGACGLMDLIALGGPGTRHISIEALYNPRQSEAYSYGSAFSRGAAIAFDGAETLYVSGTAAVDEEGQSVCVGDLRGQVIRTLDNVASLLATRQMTFDDFVSSTVFIKQGHDAELVRGLIRDRGGFLADSVYVAADICRPELVFEIDGIAVRAPGGPVSP